MTAKPRVVRHAGAGTNVALARVADRHEAVMTSTLGRATARLAGYAPALPTPFNAADEIDAAALERLCDRQIQQGASALVVCATTGKAPNLNRAEHATIVRIA